MKTSEKIITLAIAGVISGLVVTIAWAMAWTAYIIFHS